MENRAHALAAGVFVLLLGLAALASFWWLGGSDETTRELIVYTRGNVTGLNPQAQVRYRGIRVGKVVGIRLDPEDKRNILIQLKISDQVPLTRGTSAELGYQGVTGLAHILLEDSGTDPAPLPAGEGLPRIAMQSSLFEELGEAGGNVMKQAQDFLARANALLDEGNRQRLADTLSNLETTTRQLAAATASLPETTARLQRLLSDENLGRVQQTLDSAGRAATSADGALHEWRSLAKDLQAVSRQVEAAVGAPGGNGVAGVAPRLNDLAADLSTSSRQLGRLLNVLEASPQSVLFGAPVASPGPGEGGFVAPERKSP